MHRKLTVIFSADIAGYSALMERDESGTLKRLKENRFSVFDPCVAAHGGRIFKLMGDGVLIEFSSASAAVNCALEIQRAMESAEPDVADEDRLRYRIGINLGDVIVEGDDIYGEGVNVAARLQAFAPVGGIVVSRNVYDQVMGKVRGEFEDLGEHAAKNIERPVHVFVMRPKTEAASPGRPGKAKHRHAICVLPFANLSGESEQEYFADGISEDIITDLSKVSALWVAARNTAFTFKGKNVDIPQIARQLDVTHVLEGSVRKSGNRVRITAQLIDAGGGHVWAERYDGDLNDIFALQDEISEAIVKALQIKLLPEEKSAIERRDNSNGEVYDLYLMAKQFERTGSERMKPLVVRICRKIVEQSPGFARGWALLALAEAELSQRFVPGYSFEAAKAAAERAVKLNPRLAEAHAALAESLVRGSSMDPSAAQKSVDTALALDRHCYDAHLVAGYLCMGGKRYEESVLHFETACALDSDAYRPAGMVIQAYEALADKDAMLVAARRCLERCEAILRTEPDHGGALGFLVKALADLGEADRAKEWVKRAILFDPDNVRLHYNLACALVKLDDADGAIKLLEGVVPKVNAGWLHWMAVDNSLDLIRSDPRIEAMVAQAHARLAAAENAASQAG
jgi:adenylate cyclase